MRAWTPQAFRAMDLDNDGTVTLTEMKRFMCEIGNNPLSTEEWVESALLTPANLYKYSGARQPMTRRYC